MCLSWRRIQVPDGPRRSQDRGQGGCDDRGSREYNLALDSDAQIASSMQWCCLVLATNK
jgi:hypothetical protein